METGWTYTEIKEMPMDLKLLYLNFIRVEKEKEQELMKNGVNFKDKKEFKFIDEKDFYNSTGEKFINKEQIDGVK